MAADKRTVNWTALLIVSAMIAGCLAMAFHRLDFEADILSALPGGDARLQDAREVMRHHPLQDQVVIDVGLDTPDADILVAGARVIEGRLNDSGLFQSVGMAREAAQLPLLIDSVCADLAVQFSAGQLAETVAPLTTPGHIRKALEEAIARLGRVDGFATARWLAQDPLGLRGPVLARLRHLAPAAGARPYRGYLLSGDNRHLLLTAKPRDSATDTDFSRQVLETVDGIARSPELSAAAGGHTFTLTAVGAFRAALDNEAAAKGDVRLLVTVATAGIALLLVFCFSRPLIACFAFLPAIAGSAAALLVFSFLQRKIFLMTLGFGGAIISITVDHGIAYLLFLDQPQATRGREAAREVWGVGLLASLTSVGAFLVLLVGGVPILAQIGLFAALGIGFSFAFVHTVLPVVLPAMPPARTTRRLWLRRWVEKGMGVGGRWPALAAVGLALVMAGFARPEFSADLKRMNTVRPQTRAAEAQVSAVWGDLFDRVFVMAESDGPSSLLAAADRLAQRLEELRREKALDSYFVASELFPGPARRRAHLAAWRAFWTAQRTAAVADALQREGRRLGFTADAFEPFLRSIEAPTDNATPEIPAPLYGLLGIFAPPDSTPSGDMRQPWRLFATVSPGPAYRSDAFAAALEGTGVRVFDPKDYARHLGHVLSRTFLRMLAVISVSVAGLLLLFYRSWKLTAISLLPVAFSFICTLGTLGLAGHPLDLAALMLSIVVVGMGIDYALFQVRAWQRYGSGSDPRIGLVRVTVFLAAASTMIGFGVMNFARHLLLRSAGFTCFFGIFYAYLGAVVLLPPILRRVAASPRAASRKKG